MRRGVFDILPNMLPGFVLTAFAVFLFLPSLHYDFVFDDYFHVLGQPFVQSSKFLVEIFLSPSHPGNLYRPLTLTSFLLDGAWSPESFDPFFFHLTNIALHGGVVLCIYLLLSRLSPALPAFWMALLFGAHPVHVEVVANVSGRAELMAALGVLGAALAALKREPPWRSTLIGASLFLGVLAKESAYVGGLLIPWVWYGREVLHRRKPTWRSLLRTYRAEVVALCVALGLGLTLRVVALGGVLGGHLPIDPIDNPLLLMSWWEQKIVSGLLLAKYVALSVIPWPLRPDYSYNQLSWIFDWKSPFFLLYSFLTLLLLVGVVIIWRRGRYALLFFVGWFLLSFVITANFLFPIGTIFAERLAYLPSLGSIGIVTLLVRQVFPKREHLFEISMGLLVGCCALLTLSTVSVWSSNDVLFPYGAQVSPRSVKARLNLGVLRANQGDLMGALQELDEVHKIAPDWAEQYLVRAELLLQQGNRRRAEQNLQRAIGLEPRHTKSYNLLARLALEQGDMQAAERYILTVLEYDPSSFDAQVALVALLLQQGDRAKARALHSTLERIDPQHREIRMLRKKFQR